ncbi:MAG: [FeFe] hydrogenase H-cluster radical SAM maturase HydG [Bacteroidales bacterium]|jgi:2-iminoacetate synthase|nr:[FeFe] hydrogenase H-cluster radical SAM maturase HydG [Bacteroidales bacterium]
MIFSPQHYRISDEPMKPFIDADEIWNMLQNTRSTPESVQRVIEKSLQKNRLSLEETAVLINATDEKSIRLIKDGATQLKQQIYGNRIVLFAPLYIGNQCVNNCQYCGFRASNKEAVRVTLSDDEIVNEVKALEANGQKRLILVYGEHPHYNAEYIAHTARLVYATKHGNGEIRRININAAPLEIEGFRTVKEAGIGTYQIFQETYHSEIYKKYHPSGKKSDYDYRLTSLDRAQEAGLDDVGIGALFGLYDWRFEVMSLVRHVNHLEACYNVGPHTISFPRVQNFSEANMSDEYKVSDADFVKLIAILRLAVPYTGLILTAREPQVIRDEALKYGVSQMDGGTKLELGSYSDTKNETQDLNREQFQINDNRSLQEIMNELIENQYLPSFCTACYRKGRTGEHFMEFSVPGFIKKFCTPNAILTLAEYLEDYANEATAQKGWTLIEHEIEQIDDEKTKSQTREKIAQIKLGKRDLQF